MKSIVKFDKEKDRLNKLELVILFIFFTIALLWSIFIPTEYAPDEAMRYVVPKYIYNHGSLPMPDDPEVIHPFYNASYAYYPLLLGSVISAGFMKIAALLGAGEAGLLIAARLVSVISGTVFVYFLIRIAKRLFSSKPIRYFTIVLGAFIPQFVFLSSYVNNDIIALAASSMIVFAWVHSLSSGWNFKNSALLAIGIIVCALSYYNAYAWILMSIVMFVCSFIAKRNVNTKEIKISEEKAAKEKYKASKEIEIPAKKEEKKENLKIVFDYKNMLKYGIFIAVIVLIGISFFFIRSFIVNDGDFLGMKSFMNACEEGAIDFLKPSQRDIAKNNNMTYKEMLESTKWSGTTWMDSTIKSFICVLGLMQYQIDSWVYSFYIYLLVIGTIGMLFAFFFKNKKNTKMKIFYICLLVVAIITLLLSIQYSYATDYQAQGRYIYPMWMSIIIFISTGLNTIIEFIKKFIKNEKLQKIIEIVICVALIIVILYIMFILANKLMITSIK